MSFDPAIGAILSSRTRDGRPARSRQRRAVPGAAALGAHRRVGSEDRAAIASARRRAAGMVPKGCAPRGGSLGVAATGAVALAAAALTARGLWGSRATLEQDAADVGLPRGAPQGWIALPAGSGGRTRARNALREPTPGLSGVALYNYESAAVAQWIETGYEPRGRGSESASPPVFPNRRLGSSTLGRFSWSRESQTRDPFRQPRRPRKEIGGSVGEGRAVAE